MTANLRVSNRRVRPPFRQKTHFADGMCSSPKLSRFRNRTPTARPPQSPNRSVIGTRLSHLRCAQVFAVGGYTNVDPRPRDDVVADRGLGRWWRASWFTRKVSEPRPAVTDGSDLPANPADLSPTSWSRPRAGVVSVRISDRVHAINGFRCGAAGNSGGGDRVAADQAPCRLQRGPARPGGRTGPAYANGRFCIAPSRALLMATSGPSRRHTSDLLVATRRAAAGSGATFRSYRNLI